MWWYLGGKNFWWDDKMGKKKDGHKQSFRWYFRRTPYIIGG